MKTQYLHNRKHNSIELTKALLSLVVSLFISYIIFSKTLPPIDYGILMPNFEWWILLLAFSYMGTLIISAYLINYIFEAISLLFYLKKRNK